MSSRYLVLARKYRPRAFAEVVGQDVVARVLTGALREERTGHAYLFAGPRGTGKTTMARILAKCLNCEGGPTPEPCGTCERCMATDEGTEPDLIEIDAATHTGVDHIRELREQAAYAPMRARHKVYIVDEVHMLSKQAFNALLKTLEEPPRHVVFLFATTELHKVLATIVSRCQVLKLAPLAEDQIAGRLREVFEREGVKPGPGVVEELARGARGGMRDALSQADKLLALAGGEPTLEDLERLGGHTGAREADLLLGLVEEGDKPALLRALPGREGEETELVAGLLAHLRACLLATHCGEDSPLLVGGDEERARAAARGRRLAPERIELWMAELLHARERMRLYPGQERLVLELTLLDLARPEGTLPLAELEARLVALEGRLGAPQAPAPGERSPAEVPRPPKPPEPEVAGDSPAELWERLLEGLGETHGGLVELMRSHGRLQLPDPGRAEIRFRDLGTTERAIVEDRRNRAVCARVLGEVAGRPIELAIHGDGEDEPGQDPGPPRPPRSRDAFTKEVADLFGGVIEDLP